MHSLTHLELLHSNTGRLIRLCAHMHGKQNTQKRYFYNKALINTCRFWMYTKTTLLQDYPIAEYKVQ